MKFKVVGNHRYAGVAPGRTVNVDDPLRAHQGVKAGHLKPVPVKDPGTQKETADGDAGAD